MTIRDLSPLAVGLAAALVPLAAAALDLREMTAGVTVDGIRRHLVVLGSDALEGRAPGTRGGDRAAGYIAGELRRIGLRPMGDQGGYLQQVPLLGSRPLPGCRLTLSWLGEEEVLTLGEDYLLVTTGEQTLVPRLTPVVFAGYGIAAPEHDYDDYADLDVRGKVVAFLEGEPSSTDPEYFSGPGSSVYAAVETKVRIALARGAVGSIVLPSASRDQDWWAGQRRMYSFEHVTSASGLPRHLVLILNPDRVPGLFTDALFDYETVLRSEAGSALRGFHLPVQLAFRGDFQTRSFLSPNVVALLDGADPRMRDQHVVVSAHYDHLGLGPPEGHDVVYNGVVDNALGVAGALEMARVLADLDRRPRRPLLFVFPTGEEAGNLGTRYFLEHPSVAPAQMVANINVDGLAFLDTFTTVVGIGGELSDLGGLLKDAVRPLGLEVTPGDEVMWSHEAFARSDQAAFAEAGVPSILVVEGLGWRHAGRDEARRRLGIWFETRYHGPGDDLQQPMELEASRQHCRAVLALIWTVAQARDAPQWHPGVPYAYQRLLSLAGHGR